MLRALITACSARPIAVTQVFIGLTIFGLVAFGRLPLTLLPDLSYPTVSVRAELPGAAPEEVESLIARPMEEALGAVPGLRKLRSRSQIGRADLTLEAHWGTRMDEMVLDVRERLDALELPRDATRPVVLRFDPQADPVMRYGMRRADAREDRAALMRLRRVAEDAVERPLEAVAGVAAVEVAGGLEEEIHVIADVERLSAFGLTLQRVGERLAAENANISGGQVEQGTASYLVRTLNPFATLDEIGRTILLRAGGRDVRVEDVARVEEAARERDTIFRVDGFEAVEIAVYKEGDANTVEVAEAARAAVAELQEALPEGFVLELLYDQSEFIRSALDEVRTAAVIGGVLAIAVLWLFLGRPWITLVIALTIPVSVVATFNAMGIVGVGLNIMSLGGIALAIGMLVDDAVVVLENIARKREQGLGVFAATVEGTREVASPVIASTATTVAVFLPLVFVEGVAGQLFADQAIVVSAALIISMVVALTLIPALSARDRDQTPLPAEQGERGGGAGAFTRSQHIAALALRPVVVLIRTLLWPLVVVLRKATVAFQAAFNLARDAYDAALAASLHHRWLVVLLAVLVGAATLPLIPRVGLALIPPFAQGEFRAELTLPQGAPLQRTDAIAARIAREAADIDGIRTIYGSAGVGTRLNLSAEAGADHEAELAFVVAPGARDREEQLQRLLEPIIEAQAALDFRFRQPTLFTFDAPLEVELAGYDLGDLATAAARVEALLRDGAGDAAGFTEIENSARAGQPELHVRFDEARISALGMQTAGVADTVAAAVDGIVSTRFRLPDREIDIRVRGDEALRSDLAALRALLVNPDSPSPLPLSAVAEVIEAAGPGEIRRADGARVAVVAARPLQDSLADAAAGLRTQLRDIELPDGITARVTGQSEELDRSIRSGLLALTLAVFVVYLIMAAQFESLRQPFVILLSVPFAGVGAIATLWLTGTTLNVVALIGFIVLAGIVVKNGMVMVDLANRLRVEEGMQRDAAMHRAAVARLRPILITTVTTVLALTPLLLGGVEGAEVRRPLALTLIGGLSVSAVLTLFVIPVAYSLIEGVAPRAATKAGDDGRPEAAAP